MPEVMQGGEDERAPGWAKSETTNGIPYYINHSEQITQWEHPSVSEIFILLDGMHDIRFGAYRTAMKICSLRKMTNWNKVRSRVLEVAYKDMAIGPGSKHNHETFRVAELEALLNIIFQYVNQERTAQPVNVEESTEITLNFLLKCLDSGRTGLVKVRSVKNVLTALACSSLEEKYVYLYEHIKKTDSAGISQSNLKALLVDLALITHSVEEHTTFPAEYIDDAIKNCWEQKHVEPTYLLSKKEFMNWMFKEPMCIVWLPTMYRLTSSETIKHEAKCSKCKTYPIVGFRYRCLKCINVDMCQACYWTQQTIKNHKITHPTREYCLATTTGDDVRDFAKQIKYKLTRKYKRREPKVNYLKYPVSEIHQRQAIPEECPVLQNVHSRVNLLAGRLLELEERRSESPPDRSMDLDSASETRAPMHVAMNTQHVDQGVQSSLDGRERERLEEQIKELQAIKKVEQQKGIEYEQSLREAETAILEELKDKDDLERKVQHLESQKKNLEGRVAKLLRVPPMVKPVYMPTPPGGIMSPTAMTERGVNTASTSTLTRTGMVSQMTLVLGGEEEEMDTILKDLLQAFPKPTKKVTAEAMNTNLFQAGAAVRDSISSLSQHMNNVPSL